MLTVTLANTSAITVQAPGTVRWRHCLAREYGSLSIRLPRTSPAWDRRFISDTGPFLATLNTPGGPWAGWVQMTGSDRAGATFEGQHIASLAAYRRVSLTGQYFGLSGGSLAALAVSDALGGTPGLLSGGTFTEGPPILADYTFQPGQLDDVLADLMDETGGIWTVDQWGKLSWTADTGRTLQDHLTDGGWLTDVTLTADQTNGTTIQAKLFRGVVGTTTVVPAVQYGWGRKWGRRWGGRPVGTVDPTNIPALDVKEGDWLLLHLPWRSASVPGGVSACRVLGRDWDGGTWLGLTLAEYAVGVKTARMDPFSDTLNALDRRLMALEHAPDVAPVQAQTPMPKAALVQPRQKIVAAAGTSSTAPATAPAASSATATGTTTATQPAPATGTSQTLPEYHEPVDVTGGRE